MKRSNRGKFGKVLDKLADAKEWVLEHNKLVMPIVLVLCVAITVLVAINANKKERLEKEAEAAALAAQAEAVTEDTVLETPVVELEENAHPEVNTVVKNYYDAMAKGDLLTVASLNAYLDDVQKIRIEEQSKFIESYPEITVYTKPGLEENAYVAYVCSKTKFSDLELPLPGMQTFYIAPDETGDYHISDGTYDEAIYEYIKSITLQDDVVDLNNRVVVEYNDILAENPEVDEFVAYLKEKISEEVGVLLASAETPDSPAEEQPAQENEGDETKMTVVTTKVKATDVVNVRKSDSEKADKIGKAQIGQEFDLVEEKPNGWSEIVFEGQNAFIKSEFLEAVQTVTIGDDTPEENTTDSTAEQTATDKKETASSDKTKTTGKVKINDSGVRIRKEANTTSDIIDTLYTGTELELVEAMTNGWSKVKYNGEYGYVKSEFLDNE